jgi:hypothetical protein
MGSGGYHIFINKKEVNPINHGKLFLMSEKNDNEKKLITAVKFYTDFEVVEPNGEIFIGSPTDYLVDLKGSLHIFHTENFYQRFHGI